VVCIELVETASGDRCPATGDWLKFIKLIYKIILHLHKSTGLRKAIKIKAYTILLAWGMIFAHSIIPHNHVVECTRICCESGFHARTDNNDSERTLKFVFHPEDARICHISGFLFHQFSQDNLFSGSSGEMSLSPICLPISYSFNSSDIFISEIWNSSASFRAPPSA
jgi:hypothetical protein